jgi:hypothetical protein
MWKSRSARSVERNLMAKKDDVFVGKSHATMRTITGFRSLDLAFPQFSNTGEIKIGIPNNLPWLVYGAKGLGKTLFCMSIAGIIAKEQEKNIAYRSIEGFDEEWSGQQLAAVGFEPPLKVLLAEGEELEEYNIDKLLEYLRDDTVSCGILDSIAGIQPEGETNAKSVAETQMSRRAQITNKIYRHITNINIWRDSPLAFFAITHEYPAYSQYEKSTKPGGLGKQYLSRVHIKMARIKWSDDAGWVMPDGSFILKGTVDEFNYGKKGKEFYMFVLGDFGVHKGMTAVWDCLQYGVAKKKSGKIILGEFSATLNEMLKEAHARNDLYFKPFVDALQDVYGVIGKKDEDDA